MSKKISIEFETEKGRRFSTDRFVDWQEVSLSHLPTITIRIGYEHIKMTRKMLDEMLRQLSIAESMGLEYPEDVREMAEAGYRVAPDGGSAF